jgi:hypothetical protein
MLDPKFYNNGEDRAAPVNAVTLAFEVKRLAMNGTRMQ